MKIFGTPTAIPDYSREEFAEVLSMLPASERQDPLSYDAFTAQIEDREKKIKSLGGVAIRVPIQAAAVKTWCDRNSRTFCRESITAFAMFRAAEIFREKKTEN